MRLPGNSLNMIGRQAHSSAVNEILAMRFQRLVQHRHLGIARKILTKRPSQEAVRKSMLES